MATVTVLLDTSRVAVVLESPSQIGIVSEVKERRLIFWKTRLFLLKSGIRSPSSTLDGWFCLSRGFPSPTISDPEVTNRVSPRLLLYLGALFDNIYSVLCFFPLVEGRTTSAGFLYYRCSSMFLPPPLGIPSIASSAGTIPSPAIALGLPRECGRAASVTPR